MATTKTTKDDALSTLKAAVTAARTLTTAEADLRAQHAELLKERKIIKHGFASEAECIANADRLVDEHNAAWTREHGSGFVRALSGGTEVKVGGERPVPPRLPSWGDLHGTLTFADLCALQPEAMKKRLTEVIHGSGVRFGLPADERVAKLAEIDAQILTIEEQHEALVAGAAEVGIELPLLDTVRDRREKETLAAQRAAQLAADRARGVYEVSVGPALPGVTGASVGGRA